MEKLKSYTVAIFAILAGWHLLAVILNIQALPSPIIVMVDFTRLVQGELSRHFAVSLYRVGVSILLGVALALPAGLILGREEWLDRFVAPIVFVLYPIPKIVFLPVLLLLLGLGNLSKIVLITVIVFFQILVTTRDAAKEIPGQSVMSMESLGATSWQIYKHVVYPASLPKMFTALRIASGTAIAVLFFAESFATEEGLGYFIMDAWSRFNYSDMFGGIVAMALMGLLIYELLDVVERRACAWAKL
ncbi:MAG: ABC transporter permease [Candidatus Aquicultor primus]|uniref:ABC transporter permease n=1 Tax=Candidatus Aquicultor primus TaxID=1797195 RepID=A0A1F2UTY8_9ACTN|nr:MAG: ABC transporter permease [Candidatus Aquicultor primus]